MSAQTTANQNSEMISFQLLANQLILNGLEFVRKKGGDASIQDMLHKALRIYCKTVDHFGEFGNDVRLLLSSGEGSDDERSVGLNHYFHLRTRRNFAWVETYQKPIVQTITLDVAPSVAQWIRRTYAGVGVSSFHRLMELAVDFYDILLDYDSALSGQNRHLQIKKTVRITKRRWFWPWQTYTKMVWSLWHNYRLHSILKEW